MAKAKSIPSRGNWLRRDSPEAEADRAELGRLLTAHELAALGSYYWEGWARDAQLPPEQLWRTWLICAGRLPCDRGVLDRRCTCLGRMGESRRPSGELGRHTMEFLHPGGRHACLRPFGGGTPGLSRRMEPARSAGAAGRWFGNRQRSAYGNRGDRRPACNTCDNPANLTGTRCASYRSPDTEGVRSPELILKAREKRHYCNSSRPLFACHLKG